MAVANPTAAGESNEVDLSDKLATREVASMKNTSHLVSTGLTNKEVAAQRRPSVAAVQMVAANRRELRRSRAGVVSVTEKARRERVRCGS